jgi:hypothetical protein
VGHEELLPAGRLPHPIVPASLPPTYVFWLGVGKYSVKERWATNLMRALYAIRLSAQQHSQTLFTQLLSKGILGSSAQPRSYATGLLM